VSRILTAAGGVELGGQGRFTSGKTAPCRLVLSSFGLRNTLAILTEKWEATYLAGLFQNDYHPHLTTTIGNIVECNFSGYSGRKETFSWSAPVMNGIYARSVAHELVWTHDGGLVANFVYGYFVTTPAGDYVWGERFCPDPLRISRRGNAARIKPTFFLVNDVS